MNIPEDLRYTEEHEWARRTDPDLVVVGITDYAQDALGDITYLELPAVGATVRAGVECGVVESVKTFSDLFSPATGTVHSVNEALNGNEAVVNESPYGDGWLFTVKMTDPGEWDKLLDSTAYAAFLAEHAS